MFLKNINLDVAVRKLTTMRLAVAELGVAPEGEAKVPTASINIGATATRSDDTGYRDVFSRADKTLGFRLL